MKKHQRQETSENASNSRFKDFSFQYAFIIRTHLNFRNMNFSGSRKSLNKFDRLLQSS